MKTKGEPTHGRTAAGIRCDYNILPVDQRKNAGGEDSSKERDGSYKK